MVLRGPARMCSDIESLSIVYLTQSVNQILCKLCRWVYSVHKMGLNTVLVEKCITSFVDICGIRDHFSKKKEDIFVPYCITYSRSILVPRSWPGVVRFTKCTHCNLSTFRVVKLEKTAFNFVAGRSVHISQNTFYVP